MECLDSLLEWGGDLYQRDKSEKSPLDYFIGTIPSTIMNTLKKYSAGKMISEIASYVYLMTYSVGLEPILDSKLQQAKVVSKSHVSVAT